MSGRSRRGVNRGICQVCGGPTAAGFITEDFNRRLSRTRFEYLRCARCGSLALREPPDDLGAYYPPDYYRVPATRADLLRDGADAERHKLAALQRFVPAGRLVEIGPAVGAFLAVAQEAGYAVEAIEMDELCCRFLENELGVRTTCSHDPAAVLRDDGPFDVIALWHVIEHVPDPAAMIAAAADALAPGGVLALAAPNPEALQLRIFRRRWTHIDAPRHLFLVPLATLARLCTERGLQIASQTTSDHAAQGWNLFGWRESLAGLVNNRRGAGPLRLIGSVIARAAAPIERRGRLGATYTLLVQRPGLGVRDRSASA